MLKCKIVLAPFPFGEQNARKTRPVLCLTNPTGKFDEIIVSFITSKIPFPALNSDIELKSNSETGLKKDSVARLHKVFTIPKSQILGQLGEIKKEDQKEIHNELIKLINKS